MKVFMGPDPSQTYGSDGGKNKDDYQNYTSGALLDRVFTPYKLMHTHQTVEFVRKKHEEFCGFSFKKMSIMKVVDLLDGLVNESDPEVDFPNSLHAFQKIESIQKVHPARTGSTSWGCCMIWGRSLKWLGNLSGHLLETPSLLATAPKNLLGFLIQLFKDNLDTKDPRYCTVYGICESNYGLENVLMSWGHDGYVYQMMFYKFSLPPEAFDITHVHSFYPWNIQGDYFHLCNPQDVSMLLWVKEFSKFDLYTKSEDLLDVSKLHPYYQSLMDKYYAGVLCW